MLIAPTRYTHAQQPSAGDWLGKRVVQKHRTFALRAENQRDLQRNTAIYTYTVMRTDGPFLWLKAAGVGLSGWALATDCIPVDQAVDYFTAQFRAHPRDVEALILRAVVWLDQKDFDRAFADSGLAVSLAPNQSSGYYFRAIVHFEMKRYDAAIADFNQVLRGSPRNGEVLARRGKAWGGKREYDRAIADFDQAILLDPKRAEPYAARGEAWWFKGDARRH